VPEGHTAHRIAREHTRRFGGSNLAVSSPQGRFTDAALRLDGARLDRVEAYGKHLFYRFSGDRIVHVHLGIFGKFTTADGAPPPPIGELRMRLVGPTSYADLRGPTACELITPDEAAAVIARLGPDPLRKDADPDRGWARLAKSRLEMGALMLDQRVVAGSGNIFRAEVLYRAGVSPFRVGRAVDHPTWLGIWTDFRLLMRAAFRSGRIITTEAADRERPKARTVPIDDAHYVYRRTGMPCRRCGSEIKTTVQAARNLFWCPTCQAV
jgi:endonuclease VIII